MSTSINIKKRNLKVKVRNNSKNIFLFLKLIIIISVTILFHFSSILITLYADFHIFIKLVLLYASKDFSELVYLIHSAKKILCERGLSDKELEDQVYSIKDSDMNLVVKNRILQDLLFQDHLQQVDLVQHYHENELLHKAEQCYKREIKDMQDLFTETH